MRDFILVVLLIISAVQYATIKNINYAAENDVLFDPTEMSSFGIDRKLVITIVER